MTRSDLNVELTAFPPPPDIRRQWETLWLADDSATAYDNPEFITGTVAMGMPKGRTAHLLQFRNGAQLVGALPLSRWQVGLGWPRYTLWGVPALGRTGLQVLLCHPDRQAEVVAAARGWFESQLQSGSGFWQNRMLKDGRLATATSLASIKQRGLAPHRSVPLDGASSWRDLVPDKKYRADIERQRRRVLEAGGGRMCSVPAPDALAAVTRFSRLHVAQQHTLGRKSWFGEGSIPAMAAMMRQLIESRQGAILELEFSGEVIASCILLRHRDITCYWRPTYDGAHRRFSPGTVLLSSAIDRAIESGEKAWDFGFGDEEYKLRWLTKSHPAVRLVDHPDAIAARIARFTSRLFLGRTPPAL